MPVDENIDLSQPLSADDIKQLEREAVLMEKAVTKIEKELQKAEKVKNKIGSTIKEVNELASHTSPLGNFDDDFRDTTHSMIGTPFNIDGAGGVLPIGRQGMRSGEQIGSSAFGHLASDQQKFNDQVKLDQAEMNKNIQELNEKQKENRKKIETIANAEKSVDEVSNNMMGLMHNPKGFALGKAKGIIGKSVYGVLALMVIEFVESMYKRIMNEIMGLYRAGGIFDVRKLVRDEINTINSLNHILKMESGMIYFSSSTSEILRQGVGSSSNTRELEYGHKQFLRMNNE